MKIVLIGYAGSGKSTISKSIAERYNLPLLYLDCVHFLPNWNKRELSDEQNIVKQFLDDNQNWVIDGNYFDVLFEERLKKADKIILLSFCRLTCLYRAYKRSVVYKDKPRESMSPDCGETMDLDFIKHILFDRKNETVVFEKIVRKYKDKVLVINNQKELNALYKELDVKH